MAQRVIKTYDPEAAYSQHGTVVHAVRTVHDPYKVYQNDDGTKIATSAMVTTVCGRFMQSPPVKPEFIDCSQCLKRGNRAEEG